jgi:hypothetical protein
MSKQIDPIVAKVFDALLAERGGRDRFNAFQLEAAMAVAQAMIDLHSTSTSPIERTRIVEGAAKMLDRLPAVLPARRERVTVDGSKLTLHEMANLYAKVCGDIDANIEVLMSPREENAPGARPAGQGDAVERNVAD